MRQEQICFLLYRPAVPGNIGSSARALKTMGFSCLRLISPADHLSEEARMLAHGSYEILEKALVFDSFDDAAADLDFIISTTANTDKNAKVDYVSSRSLAAFLEDKQEFAGQIGIVFGTEESGLPGEILRASNIGLTISMTGTYPSLNLSQAVMVIAYELRKIFESQQPDRTEPQPNRTEPQPEASWKVLQERSTELMHEAGINAPTPLYHRIMERMSFLSGSDARLVHSVVSRLLEKIK